MSNEQLSNTNGKPTTRVYISNLNFSTTEGELFHYLQTYNAVSVLIPSQTVRGLRSDHVRPLGIGYAEFANAEDARNAVANLHMKKFKERELRIKLYVPYSPQQVSKKTSKTNYWLKLKRNENPPANNAEVSNAVVTKPISEDTIYCGYLPKSTTDKDLRECFKDYNPQEIWIFRSRHTKGRHIQIHRHFTAALITLNIVDPIDKVVSNLNEAKPLGKKVVVKAAYLSKIEEVRKIAEENSVANQEFSTAAPESITEPVAVASGSNAPVGSTVTQAPKAFQPEISVGV